MRRAELFPQHGRVGLLLLICGEALILIRVRPLSDFYFPVVWLGYILFLDAAVYTYAGRSLLLQARGLFLASFAFSAVFWWLFELFNQFVQNWVYIGGENYSGLSYVAIASIDFSTVLPAVWVSAIFVDALLPRFGRAVSHRTTVPAGVLALELIAGAFCLILPIAYPRYFFGLIWGCTFLLLDPINHYFGRPSVIAAVWRGDWRLPVSFSLGALTCGFFWEAWNYWSLPKWIYTIPYVDRWHVFEMPLPGYLGYLPFGLELFAMANFVLPLLRAGKLSLEIPFAAPKSTSSQRAAS